MSEIEMENVKGILTDLRHAQHIEGMLEPVHPYLISHIEVILRLKLWIPPHPNTHNYIYIYIYI